MLSTFLSYLLQLHFNLIFNKAANLDRRLFSKIMSDPCYSPSKDTVLAIAFAVHLSFEAASDLLALAGNTPSHSTTPTNIRERNCPRTSLRPGAFPYLYYFFAAAFNSSNTAVFM